METVELKWAAEFFSAAWVLLSASFGTIGGVVVALTIIGVIVCLVCAFVAYAKTHRWARITAYIILGIIVFIILGRICIYDTADRYGVGK